MPLCQSTHGPSRGNVRLTLAWSFCMWDYQCSASLLRLQKEQWETFLFACLLMELRKRCDALSVWLCLTGFPSKTHGQRFIFVSFVAVVKLQSRHPPHPPLYQMLPWWNLWELSLQPEGDLRAGDNCCIGVSDRLLGGERKREREINCLCSFYVLFSPEAKVWCWFKPCLNMIITQH